MYKQFLYVYILISQILVQLIPSITMNHSPYRFYEIICSTSVQALDDKQKQY